jgi:predicted amidohydrolase YtcJ
LKQLLTGFRWWEDGSRQNMLLEEGRILARGSDVFDADAEVTDLEGKLLLPKFVDAHCHILPTGLDLQKLHLGEARSHADVLELVAQRHRDQPDGWLLAVHYDQTRYEGGRHLSRTDLDRISNLRPILLRHVNGHASVANTAALAAAGISDDTADPAGGSFGRDAAGHLDGVLFEEAHEMVSRTPPTPSIEEMTDAILRAGEKMADLGIVCASDMMTGRYDIERELAAYRRAADSGCKIRMRLYVQWRDAFGPRARFNRGSLREDDRLRVSGIKVFADGAIGSATAAIYGSYTGETPAGPVLSRRAGAQTVSERLVSGQLMYSPERLTEMAKTASDADYQVCVHAIGDYAADLVMDAFEATGDPARHRIEHAMILSDAQIERLARLDCFVTFQPEFLMRFGHSYRRQLGPERAARLKRARSVLDAGVKLSFSSDRPIVAGDPWDGIRAAVQRPQGFDPAEACTWQEAIRAYSIQGAKVNGDSAITEEFQVAPGFPEAP